MNFFDWLSPEARALRNNAKICVDFDGVIHSYKSGWCGVTCIPDPPVPGAIEWLESMLPAPEDIDPFSQELREFKENKWPVPVIYSSRSYQRGGIRAMQNWLIENGLPHGYIRDRILRFPVKKPIAMLTIDDRAICFEGEFPSWEEIKNFKPWNR